MYSLRRLRLASDHVIRAHVNICLIFFWNFGFRFFLDCFWLFAIMASFRRPEHKAPPEIVSCLKYKNDFIIIF